MLPDVWRGIRRRPPWGCEAAGGEMDKGTAAGIQEQSSLHASLLSAGAVRQLRFRSRPLHGAAALARWGWLGERPLAGLRGVLSAEVVGIRSDRDGCGHRQQRDANRLAAFERAGESLLGLALPAALGGVHGKSA